eukprot:scaffold3412_cov101-Skeletonema_marinoi.AAC.4
MTITSPISTTSPTITLPAADTPLAAVLQPHPLSSIQPLPMCHNGGIDGAIPSGLTAIILLDSTPPITVTIIIPPIIPPRDVSRLFRRAGSSSSHRRSNIEYADADEAENIVMCARAVAAATRALIIMIGYNTGSAGAGAKKVRLKNLEENGRDDRQICGLALPSPI